MALIPNAFLIYNQVVYFSFSQTNPISEIIEWIWFHEPKTARSITRMRIYSQLPLAHQCRGMLKVLAKRYSILDKTDFENLYVESISTCERIKCSSIEFFQDWPHRPNRKLFSLKEGVQLAQALANQSPRKIGAILLNPELKILSWGWNDHHLNRLLHAEVMLVKNHYHLYQRPIPDGSILITTLFPCAMCASYLYAHSSDFSKLTILFVNDDPGPFAQNSILKPSSQLGKGFDSTLFPKIIQADQV